MIAKDGRGHYGYRYHVPLAHDIGDPPPPLLLTVDGITEEVSDYMGRYYLCEMATLGSRLKTCPGRLGRLARWIVQRARFEPAHNDGCDCYLLKPQHAAECIHNDGSDSKQ